MATTWSDSKAASAQWQQKIRVGVPGDGPAAPWAGNVLHTSGEFGVAVKSRWRNRFDRAAPGMFR
jgi:hypothetical protein